MPFNVCLVFLVTAVGCDREHDRGLGRGRGNATGAGPGAGSTYAAIANATGVVRGETNLRPRTLGGTREGNSII